MTDNERWILTNLYEIRAVLEPDRKEEFSKVAEGLYHGFDEACQAAPGFIDPLVPPEVTKETRMILSMWNDIVYSLDQQPNIDPQVRQRLTFHGWDGNHDYIQIAYSRWWLDSPAVCPRIREQAGANSHFPVLDEYRRMLPVFVECQASELDRGQPGFTEEELDRLAEARG